MSSLRGKLAVVTGGASGIGEATCRTLASEGATLVVADKQLEAARKVAESLPGDGAHRALFVDVGDAQSVEELFDSLHDSSLPPLTVVVNCAGVLRMAPIAESTDELFDDVISVNLKGTFLVTRAAIREMLRTTETLTNGGGAAIVNVASIEAKTPWFSCGAYAASKAGVVALTKAAAQESAHRGIRCNAVLPGYTETPMTAFATPEEKALGSTLIPLKRAAQPKEIAEAIKFLCVPSASSYVTGAALEVTGGFHM
ncbi:(3R)-3-hydroxyacyl-CoA dehydrogenase-like [Amblyomma americanum]